MCPGEVVVEEVVNETDGLVVTGSGTDEDEVGNAEMLELVEASGVFDGNDGLRSIHSLSVSRSLNIVLVLV